MTKFPATPPPTLDCIFAPSSVALIGASDDPARIGGRPLRYLKDSGYAGVIMPVNPNRTQVQGYQAFPNAHALPVAPDVVIIAVPSDRVIDALAECGRRGAKA